MRSHYLTIHRTNGDLDSVKISSIVDDQIYFGSKILGSLVAYEFDQTICPSTEFIYGRMEQDPIDKNGFYNDCRHYSWVGDVYEDVSISGFNKPIFDLSTRTQISMIAPDSLKVETVYREVVNGQYNIAQYVLDDTSPDNEKYFLAFIAKVYDHPSHGRSVNYATDTIFRFQYKSDKLWHAAIDNYLQRMNSKSIALTTHRIAGRFKSYRVSIDSRQADKIAAEAKSAIATYDLASWHVATLQDRTYTLAGLLGDCLEHMEQVPVAQIASELAIEGSIGAALDGWIRATAGALSRVPRKYRNRFGYLLTALKTVSSAYLGYQWGVMAPLRDYNSLYKELTSPHRPSRGSSAYRKWQVSDWTYSHRVSVTYKAASNKNDNLRFLQQQFGVTFFNVPKIAWELQPMSFAIDWLVNVQALITGLTNSSKMVEWPIQFVWSTVIREREIYPGVFERYYDRLHLTDLPEIVLPFNMNDLVGTFSLKNNGPALFALIANIII